MNPTKLEVFFASAVVVTGALVLLDQTPVRHLIFSSIFFAIALLFDYRVYGLLYGMGRPIIFATLSSDFAHDLVINSGFYLRYVPPVRWFLRHVMQPKDETLRVHIFDKVMLSPIGLAAGMDSCGFGLPLFSTLGFGFESVGTVTNLPCEGNPQCAPKFKEHRFSKT